MGRRVSRHRRPALDRLAGGSVVHELAGAAALATAVYLRRSHQLERPHSVPLGAGILWFGWFGFNAGSAVSAGQVAGYALVNTQLGPAPRCSPGWASSGGA